MKHRIILTARLFAGVPPAMADPGLTDIARGIGVATHRSASMPTRAPVTDDNAHWRTDPMINNG